ncbi:type II secretion system F family protein [Acidithiobacillus ferrooxidans]|jgi:tight adherence protein C|nr:type II secretion system F family protein [Acidithiobacillus ferrooxidans]
MTTLWTLLVALVTGISVGLLVYALGVLVRQMEPSLRDYMDPLPKGLRLFWPLVQFIRSTVIIFIPDRLLLRVHQRLQRAGVHYMLNAGEFVALKWIATIVPLISICLFYMALGFFNIWLSLLAALIGSFYPDLWLVEQSRRRGRLILKELPVYLDFITLMIEGGLNLTGAMQVAVDKGPPGPLRNEFSIMIRDLRAGTPKMDIFRRFGERVPLPEVRSLVSALIQSEERGGDLGPVLRAQAEQRREERFLRAEKMALEAPVKLLAPLLVFIFPITFLMLAFVIYMKFLQEGGF